MENKNLKDTVTSTNELTNLQKQKVFEICVNFLHYLSKSQNFNLMTKEEVRSASFSAIKTQLKIKYDLIVASCNYIETEINELIQVVKIKNNDCIETKRYSNDKTILEMTENEYITLPEVDDVFGVYYQEVQSKFKKEVIKEIVDDVFEVEVKKEEVKENSAVSNNKIGFKCLGYKDDKNYIWSNYRQCLFTLTQKELTQNNFLNMFGKTFMEQKYPKLSPKGQLIGYDLNQISGDIIDGCVEAGIFNLKNMFGFGIFVDPNDKDHLIVNGEEIWGTNPKFDGKRVFGKNVFANIKDLDFPKDIPVATKEETKEWFDLLGTWNYKRGRQDQLLVFGWSIVAPFAGCLNWRTHFSLTGEQGTGKSTLQTCAGHFMGEFALVFDGQSTEAGIRQKVGSSSCAVLIDEAEADSRKIANTLTFFRTASSSGVVAKGTSDQTGMDFILKLTGMIGGIVAPALNPADLSRFLRIELLPKGDKKHSLLFDTERQNEIGKKTIMFIIKNYKMFKTVCKIVRKFLLEDNDNSRYADSFTTLIAGAYIGLNQDCDENKIKEFMKEFNFDKEKIQMATKDHNNLLNKILKTNLRTTTANTNYSIIELINALYNSKNDIEDKNDIRRTLGRNGIKIEKNDTHYKMFIATKDDNFLKIMRNSKFDAGDVTSVLTRIDGSELLKDSIMIGGTRTPRSTVVTIDLLIKDYSFNEEDNKGIIDSFKDDEIPFN